LGKGGIKVEPPVSWLTRLRMISARAVVELDGAMISIMPSGEAADVADILQVVREDHHGENGQAAFDLRRRR
jgi:hypothetical protein